MHHDENSYETADGLCAKVLGTTDCFLQLNDYFQINISKIAVQPGSKYQVLIGGDVFHGAEKQLGDIVITPGKTVQFQILSIGGARFDIPCVA